MNKTNKQTQGNISTQTYSKFLSFFFTGLSDMWNSTCENFGYFFFLCMLWLCMLWLVFIPWIWVHLRALINICDLICTLHNTTIFFNLYTIIFSITQRSYLVNYSSLYCVVVMQSQLFILTGCSVAALSPRLLLHDCILVSRPSNFNGFGLQMLKHIQLATASLGGQGRTRNWTRSWSVWRGQRLVVIERDGTSTIDIAPN
jgi:hypothetical protein